MFQFDNRISFCRFSPRDRLEVFISLILSWLLGYANLPPTANIFPSLTAGSLEDFTIKAMKGGSGSCKKIAVWVLLIVETCADMRWFLTFCAAADMPDWKLMVDSPDCDLPNEGVGSLRGLASLASICWVDFRSQNCNLPDKVYSMPFLRPGRLLWVRIWIRGPLKDYVRMSIRKQTWLTY